MSDRHNRHHTQAMYHKAGVCASFAQALEFEAGQRNWLLQQDALHTAANVKLRHQVAASQAAVEAQRTSQLADWAAEEQEQALKRHQACLPQP